MQIEVKHEILTKNILKTFNENEFILDKPYIYIFAIDSVCALTLKIDNFILRDAANDFELGRIISE